jgi:hypothetical protein
MVLKTRPGAAQADNAMALKECVSTTRLVIFSGYERIALRLDNSREAFSVTRRVSHPKAATQPTVGNNQASFFLSPERGRGQSRQFPSMFDPCNDSGARRRGEGNRVRRGELLPQGSLIVGMGERYYCSDAGGQKVR